MNDTHAPFLTDIKTLRDRARRHLDRDPVTASYPSDVGRTIEILQQVLATEIVCVLRYTMHSIAATGIASESVRQEFAEHATEEEEHMKAVAERISQLGGKPNFSPEGLLSRSASQYAEGPELVDMIRENLPNGSRSITIASWCVSSATATRPRGSCWKRSWRWKKNTPATCTTCS